MRLWFWILGIFRGRAAETVIDDAHARRKAHLDARAANAMRVADARLPPYSHWNM